MRLSVTPSAGLVDEPPVIAAVDAAVGSEVDLVVSTVDAAGHRWRSTGRYSVGEDGVLQLDDPDRPWWDMRFAEPTLLPVAFRLVDSASDYEVEVRGDDDSDRVTVSRVWASGAPPARLDGDGWTLDVYYPPAPDGGASVDTAGVMLVPGTTGPGTLLAIAALLASHGYVAAVISYMGEPGMAASFKEIPAETFHSGLVRLGELPGVDAARLAVYAVSVGTIAVASAFSLPAAPPLEAMVLVAPSSVVWQAMSEGGPPPKASSITVDGEAVPYLPMRSEKLLGQILRNAVQNRISRRPRSTALTLLPAFAAALSKPTAVAAAEIPVEKIDCPMMTIAGTSDAMWPAAAMAQDLHQRRKQHGAGHQDLALQYSDAGHFFRPPATPTTVDRNESLVAGGTPAASAHAQRDSWSHTLQFLGEHLG